MQNEDYSLTKDDDDDADFLLFSRRDQHEGNQPAIDNVFVATRAEIAIRRWYACTCMVDSDDIGRTRLYTPGPLSTSQRVKKAMMEDLGSRDPTFLQSVKFVREEVLNVMARCVMYGVMTMSRLARV